jgi:hypothetical protein
VVWWWPQCKFLLCSANLDKNLILPPACCWPTSWWIWERANCRHSHQSDWLGTSVARDSPFLCWTLQWKSLRRLLHRCEHLVLFSLKFFSNSDHEQLLWCVSSSVLAARNVGVCFVQLCRALPPWGAELP